MKIKEWLVIKQNRMRLVSVALCLAIFSTNCLGAFASVSNNELPTIEITTEEPTTEEPTTEESNTQELSTEDMVKPSVSGNVIVDDSEMDALLQDYYKNLDSVPVSPYDMQLDRSGGIPFVYPELPSGLENNQFAHWAIIQHKNTGRIYLLSVNNYNELTVNLNVIKASGGNNPGFYNFALKNGTWFPDYTINENLNLIFSYNEISFLASNKDIKSYGTENILFHATEKNEPVSPPEIFEPTYGDYPALPFGASIYWFIYQNKYSSKSYLICNNYINNDFNFGNTHGTGDLRVQGGGYEHYELTNNIWVLKDKSLIANCIPVYFKDITIKYSNTSISLNGAPYFLPNVKPISPASVPEFRLSQELDTAGYKYYFTMYLHEGDKYITYISQSPLNVIRNSSNGQYCLNVKSRWVASVFDKTSKTWGATDSYHSSDNPIFFVQLLENGFVRLMKSNHDVYKETPSTGNYLWWSYADSTLRDESGEIIPPFQGGGGSDGGGSGDGGNTDAGLFDTIIKIMAYVANMATKLVELTDSGVPFFAAIPMLIADTGKQIITAVKDKITETINAIKMGFTVVIDMQKDGKSFFEIVPELLSTAFRLLKEKITSEITRTIDIIREAPKNIMDKISASDSPIAIGFTTLASKLGELLGTVMAYKDLILNGTLSIKDIPKAIKDVIEKMVALPVTFAEKLFEGMEKAFTNLFIPSPTYFDSKINEIKKRLDRKSVV